MEVLHHDAQWPPVSCRTLRRRKWRARFALIEADRLGQLRTGTTTGVAVEWMAEMSATEMGLLEPGTRPRRN